jgi:CRISPR system Cascade subunit CasD
MTQTLILFLHGPLQSWGSSSRFDDRATDATPTKSAIIGLLAASLGRPRGTDISDLTKLKFCVRIDKPGQLVVDYQTIGANYPKHRALRTAADGKPGFANGSSRTIVSKRQYLSDAAFVVTLTGEETLIEQLHHAVQNPVWTLSLGRRSCPPSEPFLLGLTNKDPDSILRDLPVYRPTNHHNAEANLTVDIISDDPNGSTTSSSDLPTHVLGKWDTYQQRRITHTQFQASPNQLTKDVFAAAETLRTETKGATP